MIVEKELDDEEECEEEDAEQCGRQSEGIKRTSESLFITVTQRECFILVDRWTRLLVFF